MKLEVLCNHPDVTEVSRATEGLWSFGVSEDYRDVRGGFIYCAAPECSDDAKGGLEHCAMAAERGAQAIVVQSAVSDAEIGLSNYDRQSIVIIRVSNVLKFYAELCAQFHPAVPSFMCAVTGTNGKSSTAHFLGDIWARQNMAGASIGTLGIRGPEGKYSTFSSSATTFDAKTTHLIVESLCNGGVSHVVMEATARGLHQQRLAGLRFNAAAFTNLSHDHLDYHKTMDCYRENKVRLFRNHLETNGTAVINISDEHADAFSSIAQETGASILKVSTRGERAEFSLVSQQRDATGQRLKIDCMGKIFEPSIPILGGFQAVNAMTALALAFCSGVPIASAVEALEHLTPVPGRLELVSILKNGALIFVDYAHSDAALENVLLAARGEVGEGSKLSLVVGLGGDRDESKRVLVGAVAKKYADRIYVTDDNPRRESPAKIRSQIIAGAGTGAINIGDRRQALRMAIRDLSMGDVLVITGKGHEDYQIAPDINEAGSVILDIDGKPKLVKTPFNDGKAVREIVEQLQL